MYFLNINKPKGITSFDCIRILRKKLATKSIGHSGTLDPLASGVMQIGVGKATKLLDYLDSDKTYIANILFGYISSTMDREGEKSFVSEPKFSLNELNSVLNSFVGISEQIPPKYSAIKVNGKKLCDIARKNNDADVILKPRQIEIYSIELINFSLPIASIKVHCKKGTYIRSLAHDIGQKLGCGAYITDLKRIQAGNFLIENSQDINSEHFCKINPLDALLLDKYELSKDQFNKIKNGCKIAIDKQFGSNLILLTFDNKLVSIANMSDNYSVGNGKLIKPIKNFNGD